jgi:DNA-binding transcriptional LysR family regulator
MELRHLRYFLAVADTLNFSRAAERLRVAQPALSRQIHDLEEELGLKLFERSTTKVKLTDAGAFFRLQVEKLLMQLDIAATGALRVAQETGGQIRIGSDWNASALPITAAAHEFRTRYPGVAVDFVELPGFEHAFAIRNAKIDVGFVPGVVLATRADLKAEVIHTCPMKVVLPAGHAMAGMAKVSLKDLRNERWVAIAEEEIPGFKTLTARLMHPARFPPRFGRTARSLAGMLAFIGTGEGIGLVPEMFLPEQPEEVRYLATDASDFDMFAIWASDDSGPHVARYLEILKTKIRAGNLPRATLRRSPSRAGGGARALRIR